MIDGVKIVPRTRHADDRGYLTEILRVDEDDYIEFGQIYMSFLRKGIIKAWHKHELQTDYFFVVKGTSKIGLHDDREGSPTKGEYQTVVLGDEGLNSLLLIPPLVWHGQTSLSDSTYLVNLPTKAYNPEKPDEIRAPVEAFKDVWSIENR